MRKQARIDELEEEVDALRAEPSADFAPPSAPQLAVGHPDIRVAVLAIALMLKNRTDAMDVAEGAHVEQVLDQYGRVQRLRELLGNYTDEEHAAAMALWDETAS